VLADPHVVVGISGAARQTVQEAIVRDGLQRQIGTRLFDFARSDHMGTFAPIGVAEDTVTFGPAFMVPTIGIPPIQFPIVWNACLANDPAILWLRKNGDRGL
jgi:hypothetical protein